MTFCSKSIVIVLILEPHALDSRVATDYRSGGCASPHVSSAAKSYPSNPRRARSRPLRCTNHIQARSDHTDCRSYMTFQHHNHASTDLVADGFRRLVEPDRQHHGQGANDDTATGASAFGSEIQKLGQGLDLGFMLAILWRIEDDCRHCSFRSENEHWMVARICSCSSGGD